MADPDSPRFAGRYEALATLERDEHEERVAVRSTATDGHFVASVRRGKASGSASLVRARKAACLRGVHTARVVDVVDAAVGAEPFVVSERVDGDSLALYWEGRRLPPIEAAVLIEHVLESLSEAHRSGLVHGGLSPDRILVADDGTGPYAKVSGYDAELRLALAPEHSEWAAPERLKERPATPAGDVYAAGLLLYRALFGRSFGLEGDGLLAASYRRMKSAPTPDDDPLWSAPELESVLRTALAPQPEERFPSAEQMLAALGRVSFADELPISWSFRTARQIAQASFRIPFPESPRRRPSVWVLGDDARVSEGAVRAAAEDARTWLDLRVVPDSDLSRVEREIDAGDLTVPWVLLFGEFRPVTARLRAMIDRERETSRVLIVAPEDRGGWHPHLRSEGLEAIVSADASDVEGRACLQRVLERTQTLLQGYERLCAAYAETREQAHRLSRALARTK